MTSGEIRVADDYDFEKLKQLCDTEEGWTLVYSHSYIKVYTHPAKNSSLHMIKVFTVFKDVNASILYDVLQDPHFRPVWDKHMIHSVEVGYLNPNNDVSYYAISCPTPVKNRDFVLHRSWLDTGKELYVLSHSVFHNLYPPQKGFVRAFAYITGYFIRPSPSGGCSFYYLSHSDPKGKLPSWFVNRLTNVLAPKTMKLLHKASLEYINWKKNNHPHYKPWLYPEQITIPKILVDQQSDLPNQPSVQEVKKKKKKKSECR